MRVVAQAGWLAAVALTSAPASHEGPGPAEVASVQSCGSPAAAGTLVRTGNTFYIAGHYGIEADSGRAPQDVAEEAQLLIAALQCTLARAGLAMDDLVSVTVFSTDPELDQTFDALFRTHFHGRPPAQAFVGAAHLQHGARFEVSGVAVRVPRHSL